jgi:hypothetical protein
MKLSGFNLTPLIALIQEKLALAGQVCFESLLPAKVTERASVLRAFLRPSYHARGKVIYFGSTVAFITHSGLLIKVNSIGQWVAEWIIT